MRDRLGWSRTVSLRQYVAVIAPFTAVLLGTFVEGLVNHNQSLMALAYVLAALLASLVLNFVTALNTHRTLIDDVRSQPFRMLAALFTTTYLNAFLHEIPNIFAHEWTYTNYPLPTLHIFSIPAIFLIGWPLLLLFPLSVYYWIRSLPSSS